MKQFWNHIDDVIALILVVGSFILLGTGIDGEVKTVLVVAAGYCFGKYSPLAVSRAKMYLNSEDKRGDPPV